MQTCRALLILREEMTARASWITEQRNPKRSTSGVDRSGMVRADRVHARAPAQRSATICFTTWSAGIALTPPPPCVAEEAW